MYMNFRNKIGVIPLHLAVKLLRIKKCIFNLSFVRCVCLCLSILNFQSFHVRIFNCFSFLNSNENHAMASLSDCESLDEEVKELLRNYKHKRVTIYEPCTLDNYKECLIGLSEVSFLLIIAIILFFSTR